MSEKASRKRVGVWLIGARGSVATTAITGAAAIKAGLAPPVGCVTELRDFQAAGLPTLHDLVFGGHDIADVHLMKRAEQLVQAGVIPSPLLERVREDLDIADREIRRGITGDDPSETQLKAVERLMRDMTSFRDRNDLVRVIVIHVASTEPPTKHHSAHTSLHTLTAQLEMGESVLPPSSLYAYAAFSAGFPYIDFTPSAGARIDALHELALTKGIPYAGRDGKTGETLIKANLAPLFSSRAMRVLSWSGTNLLGGGDGATLADPEAFESKMVSKKKCLDEILGYTPEGEVHIDYVAEMGDWKTAWDHILFEGFLGVRMTMQFTWQGCDSTLAAPLILDLARLMSKAQETGRSGAQEQLAFFFKDPIGTEEHQLSQQFEMLRDWVATVASNAEAS